MMNWGKVQLPDGRLDLSLADDLSVGFERCGNELIIKIIKGDDVSVKRYITGNEHDLYLEPGLPDLPIILKPEQYLSILPSKRLDAFVKVPLVLRVYYGTKQKKTALTDVVVQNLSRSFFGSSESGEFAYFLESPLHTDISGYEADNRSIYCPLSISNRSLQNLEFEKMILRVPYLSVYRTGGNLVASPVSITFRGQEQISQISYRKAPSAHGGSSELLSAPRQEEDKNLLRRSFYFIKNLYSG